MCNKVYELSFFDVDLPKSAENTNIVTVLIVVVVCILVFLTVIAAIVIVICFVLKKKSKRKILDLQERAYESVSPPPSVYTTSLSKSTKFIDCESDDTKQKTFDSKVELTDNVAYGSFKPLSTADATPNSVSTTADL